MEEKTCWPGIIDLEEEVEKGNEKILIDFITYIGKKKLLTRWMLVALCTASNEKVPELWKALNEFAKGRQKMTTG